MSIRALPAVLAACSTLALPGRLPLNVGLALELQDTVPKLLALLIVHQLVTVTLLEALQARVVGLYDFVRLLVGSGLSVCARLIGVHSDLLSGCGPGPGEWQLLRDHLFIRHRLSYYECLHLPMNMIE
jgi:hypothetical protein